MKIASFEGLEFLLSPTRREYYAINLPGNSLEPFLIQNYPASHLLTPKVLVSQTPEEQRDFANWANEETLLKQTDLGRLIREHGIDGFAPDALSSPYLEKWSKRGGVRVICTPHKMQKKYENKLYFDRFLHKHRLPVPKSRILKSQYDAYHVSDFPIVLQVPNSMASIGTHVIHDWDELMRFTSVERKTAFPLLCRQFITNGLPIGVSVLVGPKNMLFSAIRAQAYFMQPNGKGTYYGLQWVKTSSIDPKTIEKLNAALNKAGSIMQKAGFLGMAAFDLIIRDQEIYFLECNPRMSASAPQLAFRPDLLHGLNFVDEYVRTLTGLDLSSHKPFIPDSNYEGCVVDAGFLVDTLGPGLLLNDLLSGIYSYKNGQLNYISAKIDDFHDPSNVLIQYVRPEGGILKSHFFMDLFAHFPLLEINGNQYTFSKEAQILLEYLKDTLIKK